VRSDGEVKSEKMMASDAEKKYNFYPLVIRCIVDEGRASFADVMKYVEKATGEKIDPNVVFSVISKLVEYNILKLNEDTTGTFSFKEWKLEEG
jgi:hypothetical protein